MINRLIDFSLNNRFLVVMLWGLAMAAGFFALRQLPIDAVPDVTNVQVQVLTNSPGLAPEEVEKYITFPVETALSGIPRIEEIRSVSKFGLSVVTVVFKEGTDLYWARQQVGERLSVAKEQIPRGYGDPEMGPISTGLGEIYQFEVKGKGYTPMQLRTTLDWIIAYQLKSVPGIVEVNSFGGELKTYQISLKPYEMRKHKITLDSVFKALRENNRNVGGAYIVKNSEQWLIRGEGLVEGKKDLKKIVIKRSKLGSPLTLGHIATVEFAPMVRQGAVTRDGRGEVVIGIVMMLAGANSRAVVERVKKRIKEIQKTLPKGVTIDTFYDRTELIDKTISTVATNLLEGGALVMIVLFLLLGNFRAGLIVALAIPISMLIAFVALERMGYSGNLMSLGAIDFGLIVDGSVVMVENIMRYLHEQRDDTDTPLVDKVRAACKEVARPVVFAVGIIIIVYLPIMALSGIEGKMFKPMAFTVVWALVASLVLALTLMPVLATLALRGKVAEKETPLIRIAKWIYRPIQRFAMRLRVLTISLTLATFVGSLALIPLLGAEFVPRLDEGAFAMQVWRLPSVSLEQSIKQSERYERIVRAFPEVKTIISRTGRAEIATDPMGVEISDVYIMLKDKSKWRAGMTKVKLEKEIKVRLEREVPGALYTFSQPIELRVSELISGVRSDVAIKIFGDDLALLKKKADEVVAVLRKIRGASGTKAEQVVGLPMMRFKVKRQKLASHGMNASQVLEAIETLGGKVVGQVFEGQRRFVLQVRYDESARRNRQTIENLWVEGPGGKLYRLGEFVEVIEETGPAQISREQISRKITVETNVRGRDIASFVAEAKLKLAPVVTGFPSGWRLEWGGQFENLEKASSRLAILVPLALLLIFLLLYSSFNSGKIALMIFLNVPLAISGGLGVLYLRVLPFSISAGVGFIALFGIAVLNGVVLVSYILKQQAQGLSPDEAASEGGIVRLRPVLMTALVAALGFLPMAIATGAGAEVQRPLATVVIGGLVTSTLVTLFVLPAIYRWFAPRSTTV